MLTIIIDLRIYVLGRLTVVHQWRMEALGGIEPELCWRGTLYINMRAVDRRLVPSMMRWRTGPYSMFGGLDLVEVTQMHDPHGYMERYVYNIVLENDDAEVWPLQFSATESWPES